MDTEFRPMYIEAMQEGIEEGIRRSERDSARLESELPLQ
jgi:hypothetical protein